MLRLGEVVLMHPGAPILMRIGPYWATLREFLAEAGGKGKKRCVLRPALQMLRPLGRCLRLGRVGPAQRQLRAPAPACLPVRRFQVFVCTAAQPDYAHAVWQELDPEGVLIPLVRLARRLALYCTCISMLCR